MQVAAFLSDLKSLSICSHDAAITLVKPDVAIGDTKAHDPSVQQDRKSAEEPTSQDLDAVPQVDPDLQRAQELVSLHYNVKVNHLRSGLDPETIEARRRVDEVMAVLP